MRLRGISGAHWKGHLFLFERKPPPAYSAAAGLRLLWIFVVLEGLIGPRLALFRLLHVPRPPFYIRVPVLLVVALLLVRLVARVPLAQIGLYRWRKWTPTERSYFVQLVVIANVVFLILFVDRVAALLAQPVFLPRLLTSLFSYFLWGFYQEVMYRGILQTELVRRWGAVRGILVSNTAFTFGPLHFYHFAHMSSALPMFAGIFAIGLFFGLLFWRSGNLSMVAVAHGIGNVYIEGLQA